MFNQLKNNYREGDLMTRRFTKDRGGYNIPYTFKAYSGALHEPSKLSQYFKEIFINGYTSLDISCSNSGIKYECEFEEVTSILTDYAEAAEWKGKGREQHDIMQDYLIWNDDKTVAVEIPVYDDRYNISGHIDIIRIVNKRVQIVDFKPNAKKEKHEKVGSQLSLYRELLSYNTGIDEKNIDCYFYDDVACYKLISSVVDVDQLTKDSKYNEDLKKVVAKFLPF